MRVCKLEDAVSTDVKLYCGPCPAFILRQNWEKLTMSPAGMEIASFSSPSHLMRLLRPRRLGVKPINRTPRRCGPCISTISLMREVGNCCRSDRRSANDARCVERVRDSKEEISDSGRSVLPTSDSNLECTNSTARCLRVVRQVRGRSEAKSCGEGQVV